MVCRLAREIMGLSHNRPWFIIGDWNEPPEACTARNMLRHTGCEPIAVRDQEGTPIPSRWKGSRCIDWMLTNSPARIADKGYLEDKWSDHKALYTTIVYERAAIKAKRPIPTRSLAKPEGVEQEAWRQAVTQ